MSHLTKQQRYTISAMLAQNFSQTTIAAAIGKDKSVVSRELRRNCDMRSGEYRSELAQRKYEERLRFKPKAIKFNSEVKERVGDLYTHLRRKGRKNRKRGAAKDGRGIIRDRVSIDYRSDIVNEKKRFGDLELDTVIGKNHKGAILTVNDRATGLCWLALLEKKESEPLNWERGANENRWRTN